MQSEVAFADGDPPLRPVPPPPRRLRRGIPVLLLAIGAMFGACQDDPTTPPPRGGDLSLARAQRHRDSIRAVKRDAPDVQVSVPHLEINECYTTSYERDGSDTTRYSLTKTGLVEGEPLDRGTLTNSQPARLLYWRRKRDTKRPTFHAHCVIAAGEAARAVALEQLTVLGREDADTAPQQPEVGETVSSAAAELGVMQGGYPGVGIVDDAAPDVSLDPPDEWAYSEDVTTAEYSAGVTVATVTAPVVRLARLASVRGEEEECQISSEEDVWPSQFDCYDYECYMVGGSGGEGGGDIVYDCFGPCDGSQEDGYHTAWGYGDGEYEIEMWFWNENQGECGGEPPPGGGGGGGGGGQAPVININCTPSSPTPSRGTTITCTATSPTGSVVMEYWKFKPNQTDYPSLPDTIHRSTNVSSTSWSGPMAAGGTLVARGRVNGVLVNQNQVGISVGNRGWTWTGQHSISDSTACDPAPGVPHYAVAGISGSGWTVGTYPTACTNVAWWLSPHFTDGNGIDIDRIPGGPNEGIFYLKSIPDSLRLASQIHADFKVGGSYPVDTTVAGGLASCSHLLPSGSDSKTVTWVNVTCKGNATQFDAYIAFVWAHEHCHMTRAVARFGQVQNVPNLLDNDVRSDSAALWNAAKNQLQARNDSIKAYSDALHAFSPNEIYSIWLKSSETSPWGNAVFTRRLPSGPTDPICQ